MDTKLKNKKVNLKVTLIVLFLILLMSVGIVSTYGTMRRTILKNNMNLLGNMNFYNYLDSLNYSNYINSKEGISAPLDDGTNSDYYILNKENNSVLSDFTDDTLVKNILDNKDFTYTNDDYDVCIISDYDKDGNIKVRFLLENSSYETEYQPVELYDVNVKDATFIYGIKDIGSSTLPYDYFTEDIWYEYRMCISVFSMVLTIILLTIALCIPYRKEKDIFIIKQILKKSVELKVIIPILTIIIGIFTLDISADVMSMRTAYSLNNTGMGYDFSKNISYIINILLFTMQFIVLFISIVIIKDLFINGIKNKSLIFKLKRKMKNKAKSMQLEGKNKEIIKIILVFNFIVVSLMCTIWLFGIIVAFVYSVILYVFIRKYIKNIIEKYRMILEETKRISEGDLSNKLSGDFSLLEPLKDEILNLKDGLEKSIEEEVKNRKLKGELISNVSNDLNIPVNSIMDYVENLKNDNLSDKEKQYYLENLEKKSYELKKLIEDIFEISKANSGDIKLNLDNVDIVSLIKQTIVEMREKIDNSKLKLNLNVPDEKVILCLDGQKVFRIFETLIDNMVKYSLENTRVYIEIINKEEKVYISFKNISREEISNYEDKGLGLQIARSFIEVQGGKFEVKVDGDLFKVIISFNMGVN
ncbi:MAG: HAMP domain-containing sensor histidine kinase [Clostridium sp.]|uniref:HAMP domain-containing sensor histidine kinase n=1 Tax=Clostridium sp. TaxID=1506 RepID=UPI002FC5D4E5